MHEHGERNASTQAKFSNKDLSDHDVTHEEDKWHSDDVVLLGEMSAGAEGRTGATCVDLGASMSVTGLPNYLHDCSQIGIGKAAAMSMLEPSSKTFAFGRTKYKSLGAGPGIFAAQGGKLIKFQREVIDSSNIPSLLGLTTMMEMGARIDVRSGKFLSSEGWKANLEERQGHLWLPTAESAGLSESIFHRGIPLASRNAEPSTHTIPRRN